MNINICDYGFCRNEKCALSIILTEDYPRDDLVEVQPHGSLETKVPTWGSSAEITHMVAWSGAGSGGTLSTVN